MAETTFVHFAVEGDRLAVSLDQISEVARVSQITPVPRAPAIIRGLANIRGRVITLVDVDVLYAREDAAPPPQAASGHAVVLSPPHDHLALFTRSRVDTSRGGVAPTEGHAAPSDASRAPSGGLVICNGVVAHLLPPVAIAEWCEERIMDLYRRGR